MEILEPLYDRIVVKVKEVDSISEGGLILPDNAKEKPQQGVVMAVGRGRISDDGQVHSLIVQRGDIVLFGKHTGTPFNYNSNTYLMMKEAELFAVVRQKVEDVGEWDVSHVMITP